ncbi:MAG: aminotransferase class I/II-fold pyridoxal phosphate-dependent enzyme, partial [Pseudomonadota bacterium]
PVFDMAYAGFGEGWEADCAGLRTVLEAVPEGVAAVSCSKNFGLYRDRAGAAYARTSDPIRRARAEEALAAINRNIHSMPPDHGGALVRIVLEDPALRADWRAELDAMRARLNENRRALAEALAARPGGQGLSFVGDQRGMFSLLGLDEAQVTALRERHAIYAVPGGRINLAGMRAEQADRIAEALLSVL